MDEARVLGALKAVEDPEAGMVVMTRAPRGRLALLFLGFVSLAFGVAGGLSRLTPFPVPLGALALHGPLMVSAFFGTVIALERAAALGLPWAYLAPLGAGAGGVLLVAGFAHPWVMLAGLVLMAAAAGVFVVASLIVFKRHRCLETATLAAGAAAWLAGNAGLLLGLVAVPWWIAFFALTVAGERLELSRYLKRPAWVRTAFLVLACGVAVAPLAPRALGVLLAGLAAWLLAFDLARVTIRQSGLPRFVAACLLPGYAWLAVGGIPMALQQAYDTALHAVFVGFVFSMVFGHAPVILPAVLRLKLPYHPILYLPLLVLHASLAVRAVVSAPAGAWGNAAAIALFITLVGGQVLHLRMSMLKRKT